MTTMRTFYILTRTAGWMAVLAPNGKAAIKSSREAGIQVHGISGRRPRKEW